MATQTKAQLAAAKKKADAAAKKNAAAAPAAQTAAVATTGAVASYDINALTALVAATTDPARQFMYMSPANTGPLEALGYAETRADMVGKDEAGVDGVAARATPAGIEALAAAQAAAAAAPAATPAAPASPFAAAAPAPAAQPAAAPAAATTAAASAPAPSAFKIVSGVPIPAAKRFGKASTYPFDALAVGQGFFVPATKERENPAKSMASTVNSAKARYAVLDGKNEDGSDKFKNTREFVLRNVADGGDAGFGTEFKGVRGAGIWRTA